MDNPSCKKCRFGGEWEPEMGPLPGNPAHETGRCHRYAPGRNHAADPREFYVRDDYWCGDFKPVTIQRRWRWWK